MTSSCHLIGFHLVVLDPNIDSDPCCDAPNQIETAAKTSLIAKDASAVTMIAQLQQRCLILEAEKTNTAQQREKHVNMIAALEENCKNLEAGKDDMMNSLKGEEAQNAILRGEVQQITNKEREEREEKKDALILIEKLKSQIQASKLLRRLSHLF